MRLLRRLLSVVVVLVVALLAGSFLLPRTVALSRTVTVNAPAEVIFPYINSTRKMTEWSPWTDRDPDMQVTWSGPDQGVGNRMDWVSDNRQVGSGSQEITVSVENQLVETALDFGNMGTAVATLALLPGDGATRVTWGFVADSGYNPLARWMGTMLDRWVGADYEAGLARLKALVEG